MAKKKPSDRARRAAAKALAVPTIEATWPPIDADVCERLFDLIESGDYTVKTAAPKVGLRGNTIYQWKRRFPAFSTRLDEAVDVGIDMATDGYREFTAHDRDSAAGAQVRMTALDKYLQRKRPERFHVNPFKPAATNVGELVLGVVVVPAKQTLLPDLSLGDPRVIEGHASVVPRLPEPVNERDDD